MRAGGRFGLEFKVSGSGVWGFLGLKGFMWLRVGFRDVGFRFQGEEFRDPNPHSPSIVSIALTYTEVSILRVEASLLSLSVTYRLDQSQLNQTPISSLFLPNTRMFP